MVKQKPYRIAGRFNNEMHGFVGAEEENLGLHCLRPIIAIWIYWAGPNSKSMMARDFPKVICRITLQAHLAALVV